MATEFHENSFPDKAIRCDACQWQGKGSDANIIDFYGVVPDKEVHCPSCDKRLGILKKSDPPPGESATDLSFQLG